MTRRLDQPLARAGNSRDVGHFCWRCCHAPPRAGGLPGHKAESRLAAAAGVDPPDAAVPIRVWFDPLANRLISTPRPSIRLSLARPGLHGSAPWALVPGMPDHRSLAGVVRDLLPTCRQAKERRSPPAVRLQNAALASMAGLSLTSLLAAGRGDQLLPLEALQG